jgi:SpoVK/Ycf46/Vps4 family AAA+-type ATPase
MLTKALLCLFHWDVFLADNENAPPPDVLAELCAHPAPIIVAGRNVWQAKGIERQRPLLWFETSMPDYSQRLALWRHFLQLDEAELSKIDISALAGQFLLTTDQIRDVVSAARDKASQRGSSLTSDDLLLAARAHSNPRLAHLARKIVPRYNWLDIILPVDQLAILHEIIATVRGRPLVLEEWGVGQKLASSAGITVLFAGPPGTGKTMAAEIIARELGLDLYKIDLSTIVSKYIGETEKNLEKIFEEAQSSNAILFFDEADAIFGKRSEVKDAHDRYANIEVSYLLQRMEAYDGVTILATNLRANLDEAFTRRLQFAVDFPFPEKPDRLRIWQTLFPPDLPRSPDLDFDLLAQRFKLTGGNIRNIIVSAAYLAASDGELVMMDHILHGTRRELQKMGRLVNEADLQIRNED